MPEPYTEPNIRVLKTISVNMDNLLSVLHTQFNMTDEQVSIFSDLVEELELVPYVYIPEPTWDDLLNAL